MQKIPGRYTLFTHIPVYFDGDKVLTDQLWAKDLVGHFPYIARFQMCCPVEPLDRADKPLVEVPGLSPEQILPIRRDYGYLSILRNLLPNFLGIARALGKSDIVHAGGAGWAFPHAFFILPLRPFFRFDWVMVIESAFWMKPATGRASPRAWLRHHIYRGLLGASLRRSAARIFTTDAYRRFFNIGKANTLIAPAVWYDDADVISGADQADRLAALTGDEIRLLFPARLVPDKGIDVILAAVEALEARLPADAPRFRLDIIGDGPLAATCRAFAASHKGRVKVAALEPVDYGAPFFDLLRGYHAVLLANRQHEQPRIVFDAFAQGVPVISSDTDGVREIVHKGEDALLYPIDDADALAERIMRFATDPALRARLLHNAPLAAKGQSHQAMHRKRHAFFTRTLAGKPDTTAHGPTAFQNSSS